MTRSAPCDAFAPAGPGRAFLVAEIGNNHEGDLSVAKEMVRRAADAGADAVKFQTFRTELFLDPSDAPRSARYRRFELSPRDFGELADAARSAGVAFFSTPLDLGSVDVLEPLVWAFKIASGDNDFTPLLERVVRSGKPVIVSTGASDMVAVDRVVATLRGASRVALLHCVSAYPAPIEEANLRSIVTLRERFPDLAIGYSDHTLGIDACLAAAALGARIIEKHFTLDKARSDFRDHQLSADPSELRALADGIERVGRMLGEPGKWIQPSEAVLTPAIRRSVFLARDVPRGHVLGLDDLVWLRPGDGVPAARTAEVIGRRTTKELRAGEKLSLAHLLEA